MSSDVARLIDVKEIKGLPQPAVREKIVFICGRERPLSVVYLPVSVKVCVFPEDLDLQQDLLLAHHAQVEVSVTLYKFFFRYRAIAVLVNGLES